MGKGVALILGDRDFKIWADDDVRMHWYGVKTKKKFWSTEVPELLFDRWCLKQTNKPTAEVAYPWTDLDDEKDEQVDE